MSINKFIRRIKNIIRWIPVLWQDRDSDYEYVYLIMLTKLKNKEKFFRSDKCLSPLDGNIADEIKEFKEVLERLSANYYYYKEACKEVGITEYKDVYNNKEVSELENKMINDDLNKVFSKEFSDKVRGWWD